MSLSASHDRSQPSGPSTYDEVVLAPRWMLWVGMALAALGGLAASSTLLDAARPLEERLLGATPAVVAAVAVGAVAIVFTRLRIHAGAEGVRVGFGPFTSTLAPAAIEGASAERYRWVRFGGWGLRWSWGGKDRAFSVPFVSDCVEIRLRGGRRFVVSSRQAERFAGAVNALAAGRDGMAAL